MIQIFKEQILREPGILTGTMRIDHHTVIDFKTVVRNEYDDPG